MKRLLPFAAIVVAGCGDSSSPSNWTSTVDTARSGMLAVTNIPPADDRPRWWLEEELRIGSVEGAGPSSFGQIKGLAIHGQDRIIVLDAQAQEIRVFASDGRHIVTHGRKGGGPGEFEAAFGLMQTSDSLLYVPDQQNARMSVLHPDRGFITSYPLNLMRWGFVWDGAMRDDDHILVPSIARESRRPMLAIYSPDMVQVDSVLLPEEPAVDPNDPPGAYAWAAPGGSPSGYAQVPFYPNGAMLLDRTGDIWSSPAGHAGYRITRWNAAGDTALIITTQRPALPVTNVERDSALQQVLDRLSRFGVTSLPASKIPSTKPFVLSLFAGQDGEVWVETSSPDSLRRYDIYDRDGTPHGSVATNLRIYPWVHPVVSGDYVYAVVTDELDVQYVVRARLVDPPEDVS